MTDFTGWLFFALALSALTWWNWFGSLLTVSPLASPLKFRLRLLAAPPASVVLILISLPFLASPDVRDDGAAMFFYTLLGAAWLGGATFLFPLLGVSVRDDATERHNRGASVAILGALAGVTCCFIGSNTGSGPGPDAVLFCAALATLTFFLCWLILELYASPSEQITVARDFGAGVRLAGFTTSLGIVLGSAVAGDWCRLKRSMQHHLIELLFKDGVYERSETGEAFSGAQSRDVVPMEGGAVAA